MHLRIVKSLIVFVPIVGFALFVLRPFLSQPAATREYSLVPLYSAAVESAGPFEWVALFLVGFVFGAVTVRNSWLIGCLSVVFLPVLALIEMTFVPTSHNLLPFEFAFYALYAAMAAGGAAAGAALRNAAPTAA